MSGLMSFGLSFCSLLIVVCTIIPFWHGMNMMLRTGFWVLSPADRASQHRWTQSSIMSSVYSGLMYPVLSANERSLMSPVTGSFVLRPSYLRPKASSFFLAENDCLNLKLQLALLEHRSVSTHCDSMFVRCLSPAHDILLSTLIPVSLIASFSAWMAWYSVVRNSWLGPLCARSSSQNLVSFMGNVSWGNPVSLIAVVVSGFGFGSSRPVTPGVFPSSSASKSMEPSGLRKVACCNLSVGGFCCLNWIGVWII